MNPTTEHTEHPETARATKQPGGHPILIALAVLAVVAASVAFLLLRAPLLRMASDLMPDWKTGPGTPGDWALLVPSGVVVGIAASIVVLLAVASLLKTGAFALGLAIFFLVAAPCFFFYASASVGMATLARYGLAISAASAQSSDADGRVEIPFYYEWSVPLTSEEMKNALKPVVGKIAGLDRLVTFTEHYRPPRADFVIVFSQTGNAEGNEFRETVEMLYAALDEVAVPEGAVLRVPLSVKGVKTPGTSSATNAPAAPNPHAETAEPDPHAKSAESAESPDGRAPSRPEGGSGEAEPPPSVATPPAP